MMSLPLPWSALVQMQRGAKPSHLQTRRGKLPSPDRRDGNSDPDASRDEDHQVRRESGRSMPQVRAHPGLQEVSSMVCSMRAPLLRIIVSSFGAAVMTAFLSGCLHAQHPSNKPQPAHAEKNGPPPWAPAHGYRHKHPDGVELVFKSEIGVYVVVGHPGHYWDGQRYYRGSDGRWHVSVHLQGPWGSVAVDDVPPGLRAKHGKKKRHQGHGPPAKHAH